MQSSNEESGPLHLNILHLNEEQFAVCALGGEPDSAAAAHLSECSGCREELARFGVSVAEFSSAALDWSASRSPVSLRQRAVQRSQRARFAIASWALATGFVLAAGVSLVNHREHRGAVDMSAVGVASEGKEGTQCSDTEIAQDNKMMQDVNMAIDDEPSPFSQYGLKQVSMERPRAKSRNQ
jgi:hypothetical protein